jgi:hypothetical protein
MTDSKLGIMGEGIAGVVAIAFSVVLSPLLRRWYSRWGATEAEVHQSMPGDELVPRPKSEITLAITIQAPADCVWPWYVQLGCRRGGWYSYDLLDNGGVPSADRIIPEYQQIQVGDEVWGTPDGKLRFPVATVEPGRALVLGGTTNARTAKPADPNDPSLEAYYSGDQSWLLSPLDDRTTRLVFRNRTDWNPSFLNTLVWRVMLEPISFVMGRKMLLNIRRRAEAQP